MAWAAIQRGVIQRGVCCDAEAQFIYTDTGGRMNVLGHGSDRKSRIKGKAGRKVTAAC